MDIVLLDTSGHLANPLGGPDTLRVEAAEGAESAPSAPPGTGIDAPPIYAPAARAEVRRIIDWLADQGDRPRLFAWFPEVAEGQTDHFTDLVYELARDGRALPICIVALRALTPALVERLYVRGLRRIRREWGVRHPYRTEDFDAYFRYVRARFDGRVSSRIRWLNWS